MASVNLLFLAPHWRVTLVRAFQESWKRHSLPGRLIGADSDPLSATSQVLETNHTLPPFDSEECLPRLLEICRKEKISAILPLTNKAIEFLDVYREKFSTEEIELYLQSADTIQVCHDKWQLASYLNKLNLPTPATWLGEEIPRKPPFPLISKPRRGEGSRSCHLIRSRREMDFYIKQEPENVLQTWLEGTEYSIDWYADRNGKPLVVVPRIRLSVKGGEVMQSRIDLDPKIIDTVQLVGNYLKLRGPCTLQGIRTEAGEFFITDINLRFGSGYVHTLSAGADVPAMMHEELSGQCLDLPPPEIRDGSVMTRYLDGLFL